MQTACSPVREARRRGPPREAAGQPSGFERRKAAPIKDSGGRRKRRSASKEEINLPSKYLLKLYVTGTSPRTSVAIANLQRICEQELEGKYELEIIDVLESPQLAEDEKILATPTLIKQLPPPLRRVIGDLSDKEKVLFGLEVRPALKNDNRAQDAT
jgi:circadian clock protein KaiB